MRLGDAHLLLHDLDGWAGVASALAIFALAEVAGAYGFVAGFVGGLAFRRFEYGHEYNRGVHDGMEQVEKFLELAVIVLLASMLTGVASINYAAIAIGAGVLSAGEESLVFWTIAACVIVSVVVHGVSAEAVTRRTIAVPQGSGARY